MKLDTRLNEWDSFAQEVHNHILNYTVKQYGDLNLDDSNKGDQLQNSSLAALQGNIKRYANRMLTNSRGRVEAERDLLKLAHYAAVAWGKYQRNEIDQYNEVVSLENPSEKEIQDLLENKKIKKITVEF